MSILEQILLVKREEVERAKRERPLEELQNLLVTAPPLRDFKGAVRRDKQRERIKLIAELKKASPSKGLIRPDFDAEGLLGCYERSLAVALSVLTDEPFFQGRLDYLSLAKRVTSKPVLRKDFIFDEYQLYEARAYGADAVLLIVAGLEPTQLQELMQAADELQLATLVEVHSEAEMERALSVGAQLIGVNNRDLRTFEVDLQTTLRLLPFIPKGCIVVSESGLDSREDVVRLEGAEVDAILVGESLMRSANPAAKAAELVGGDGGYGEIFGKPTAKRTASR